MNDTLSHVTLSSGHVRLSPRAEVGGDVVATLKPIIARALQGSQVPIPGYPGYTMRLDASGDCCVVTVFAQLRDTATPDPEPVVTFGVASHPSCSDRLWRLLHSNFHLFRTDPRKPPAAPWCAAMLHPAALALRHESPEWIADFERCLAWAWIEQRGEETSDEPL